jgi:hypothetical protein
MAGSQPEKAKSGNPDATQGKQEEERNAVGQEEERDLTEASIADEEQGDTEARDEEQDLNQGMQTGTYDDPNTGINWPADYRIKKQKKDEPDKQSG